MDSIWRKWFWGRPLCKIDKKFDGLNPEVVREYNKFHILKNMGIALVGMDFEDRLENGSRAIELFLISQSKKVRQRKLVGKNGVIIKNKGDIHYVDCNITGSNDVFCL